MGIFFSKEEPPAAAEQRHQRSRSPSPAKSNTSSSPVSYQSVAIQNYSRSPSPHRKSSSPKKSTNPIKPTRARRSLAASKKTPSAHKLKSVETITSCEPFRGQIYEDIRKKHSQKGQLFVDTTFPTRIEKSVFYRDPLPREILWMRPFEICANPQFIVDDIDMHDLDQGALGNCWLIAACASVANKTDLLDFIVPDKESQSFSDANYCGLFHFRFWHYGKWVDVCVDDFLPVNKKGKLIFCRNKQEPNEFWAALFEKAYAKLYGGYHNLIGGFLNEAFVDLTGGVPHRFELFDFDPLELWKIMKDCENNSVIGVSTHANDSDGLVGHHAYTVVLLECVKDLAGEEIRLVQVRNPWGDGGEWEGDWCDRSSCWKTLSNQVKKRLHSHSEDGVFWISLDDFYEHFEAIEVCTLFTDSYLASHHGEWTKNLSGGSKKDSYWTNPQILFTIDSIAKSSRSKQEEKLTVSLLLKNTREIPVEKPGDTFRFDIYKVLAEHADRVKTYGTMLNASQLKPVNVADKYEYRRDMTISLSVEPGTYVIIPSRKRKGITGEFFLRVFAKNRPIMNLMQLECLETLNRELPRRGLRNHNADEDDDNDEDNYDQARLSNGRSKAKKHRR